MRQAQERLARALQRALELPEGCALDDERRGAGFEHPLDGLLVVETRERDDAGLRAMRANLPRRLDAVEPGHPDVHEHDVGLELSRERNGGLAVGRFAHDLDLWMIREDRANEPTCLVRVVADQQLDHRHPLEMTFLGHLLAHRACRAASGMPRTGDTAGNDRKEWQVRGANG